MENSPATVPEGGGGWMRGAREGGREKMGEIRVNASAVPGDKS